MSDRGSATDYRSLAGRWRELAVRRGAYLAELYSSGRWTRYYTEDQLLARLREVVAAAEAWEQLAEPAAVPK